MMELTADQQLIFHWIPILLGILLMSPFGEGIGKSLSSRWPSLETQRGRTLGGSLLVMFGGFTVSTHTLWIHNKAKEIGSGNFCAGDGVWDCSSVIGNDAWNTMPVLDIPWGIVGMLAFSVFMWLMFSIAKEPSAEWVSMNLYVGRMMGIAGILMIFYLIYAEIEIGKLCQYCTTAHVAHIVSVFGFFRLTKMHGTSAWGAGMMSDLSEVRRERRAKRGGYVAPKQAREEE